MVRYAIDKERATLEAFRKYESALAGAGFEIIFSCKKKDCGGFKFSRAAHGDSMSGGDKNQRYIAAKLVRPEGTAYVSPHIKKAYEVDGPSRNTVYANLRIIETAEVETDKVTASPLRCWDLYNSARFSSVTAISTPASPPRFSSIAMALR